MVNQLTAALDQHSILDHFQSGFCRFHWIETALLRVSQQGKLLCCSGWTLPQFLIQLNVSFRLIGWSARLVYQYLVGVILFIPVWLIIFCSYFKAQISPLSSSFWCTSRFLFWGLCCFYYICSPLGTFCQPLRASLISALQMIIGSTPRFTQMKCLNFAVYWRA